MLFNMFLILLYAHLDREGPHVRKGPAPGWATTVISIHYELSETTESNGPNYRFPCVIVALLAGNGQVPVY